jgi:hypothetical protein
MQYEESCLEFEVASMEDVKVLLRSWYQLLNKCQELRGRGSRLTQYRLITVSFDDHQRPAEVVILRFVAPQHLLDRLVEDLRSHGLETIMEVFVPGFMAKARLQKRLYGLPSVTK